MTATPKILAFAGSTRRNSFNKKLVQIAAQGALQNGAEATFLDLADYRLPIFDEDLEAAEGLPENVLRLKEIFIEHQGLLIASPEYNGSVSAVLKNTIDWLSRPAPGEAGLACFTGKVAAVMSTSPGGLGGLRGLVHIRAILGNIGVIVLPGQVAVPKAHDAFAADGSLKDPKQQTSIQQLGHNVATIAGKLF
ncbi:MAG: NAD(P)H-dependent oxidoreductase [Anaerolineae bacterium]|nr:NAD(P)H-dependent oxidoreductase [Gloeobacterales cyanobacterium ES-bin-313]